MEKETFIIKTIDGKEEQVEARSFEEAVVISSFSDEQIQQIIKIIF